MQEQLENVEGIPYTYLVQEVMNEGIRRDVVSMTGSI